MGDNLPELLYRAFCDAAGLSYGTDETPSFHNLPTDHRYAWEQVAAKARRCVYDRVLIELDGIERDIAEPVEGDDAPRDIAWRLRRSFGR